MWKSMHNAKFVCDRIGATAIDNLNSTFWYLCIVSEAGVWLVWCENYFKIEGAKGMSNLLLSVDNKECRSESAELKINLGWQKIVSSILSLGWFISIFKVSLEILKLNMVRSCKSIELCKEWQSSILHRHPISITSKWETLQQCMIPRISKKRRKLVKAKGHE